MHKPVSLFISYESNDSNLLEELVKHLKQLERSRDVVIWEKRLILPGANERITQNQQMNTADVVLLLVSSDYLHNVDIWEYELKQAYEKEKRGNCLVIPVLLRPCDHSYFAERAMLPLNKKGKVLAVSSWKNRDKAFLSIINNLNTVLEKAINQHIDKTVSSNIYKEVNPSNSTNYTFSKNINSNNLENGVKFISQLLLRPQQLKGATNEQIVSSYEWIKHWFSFNDPVTALVLESTESEDLKYEVITLKTNGLLDNLEFFNGLQRQIEQYSRITSAFSKKLDGIQTTIEKLIEYLENNSTALLPKVLELYGFFSLVRRKNEAASHSNELIQKQLEEVVSNFIDLLRDYSFFDKIVDSKIDEFIRQLGNQSRPSVNQLKKSKKRDYHLICNQCNKSRQVGCDNDYCSFFEYYDSVSNLFGVPPRKYYLSISGIVNSGRSWYLLSLVYDLLNDEEAISILKKHGIVEILMPDPISKQYYRKILNEAKHGRWAITTQNVVPATYSIFLKDEQMQVSEIVLFDTPGEFYEDSDYPINNNHYLFGDALIHFIDPREDSKLNSLLKNPKDFAFGRCKDFDMEILNSLSKLKIDDNQNKKLDAPLALCLSKFDLIPLALAINPLDSIHLQETDFYSHQLRVFLENNSASVQPSELQAKFRTIKNFAIAPYGSDDIAIWGQNKPIGTLAPFLWVLKKLEILPNIT